MSAPTQDPVSATLYVRTSLSNHVRQQVHTVLEDLETLVEEGALTDVDVETWDSRIPLEDGLDRFYSSARTTYERLQSWAGEADRSLEPYFTVRDEQREPVLVPPIMCLVLERDDDVEAVYPSETEAAKATVADGVARVRDRSPVVVD